MGTPAGRDLGNLNDEVVFKEFQEQAMELSRLMDEGRIRFKEVKALLEEMSKVRNSNDGFGEIHIKLITSQNKHEKRDDMIINTGMQRVVRMWE